MKLTKNLGKIGKYYYGEFECPFCLQKVVKLFSHGKRDKSCGCKRNELISKNSIVHGGANTKLYGVWVGIKQRIQNKNALEYHNYGGRGITICPEWAESYIIFRDWALNNGYQENLQIDRKNTNGNYEPSNCNWVTAKENARNRRNNKLTLEKANEIRTLSKTGNYTQQELAEKYGVSKRHVFNIIHFIWWK